MHFSKKSLGQNFLVDKNIIEKIVNLTDVQNKNILEIGPGKGALTEQILKNKPRSLILIEKDSSLSKELKEKYKNNKKVKIYNNDILKFNFENQLKNNSIIFGNLPYNISSQILVKIIKFKKSPPRYSSLILMFQKEMAERILAKYKTLHYGRLSILTSYKLQIFNKFNVSPNCFYPKPKVNSTVLYFKPKDQISYNIKNMENLEKITNTLFSNKRKMINKAIKKIFDKKKISVIKNLNLSNRPSEIKPEKYYELTEFFEEI